MSEFSPLLVLAVIWLLIGIPLSKLSKVSKQQQTVRSPQKKQGAGQPQEAKPAKSEAPAAPESERVLQPTISITEHDDSIYQGSLNAVTGEGYDPCHNEQLAPLTAAESAFSAPEEEVPGLRLGWSGNEIVRGFVMSEILKRK